MPFPRAQAMRRPDLQTLLALSRQMLGLARSGDWQEALNLQHARREQLEAFFATQPASDADAREIADGIRIMLSLDAEVTDLVQAQRQLLLVEARQARQAHSAANAYLGCMSR